jgi:NADH dehydrogenase FAD-containing subunit
LKSTIVKFFSLGCVVQAEVISISDDSIRVHGRNEPIHFDYLVIATGSSYAFPGKVAAVESSKAINLYDTLREKIEKSHQILIIGGGPVGVELAGEIATDFPGKDITLVHSQTTLIQPNVFNEKFYIQAQEKLEKLNVKIILNDRIELSNSKDLNYIEGKKTYTTQKSKTNITADLTFICTGTRINNKSLLNSPFKSKINPQTGRIIVNNYLQVDGYENIFAIGDISDKESKLAYFAAEQGEYVAKLIPLLQRKKPYPKEYQSHLYPGMFLTIGRNGGVGQLPIKSGTVVG